MLYALILAGGVGSRLWPKSRNATPKQFLDLTGTETMLQTTVRRILPLIPLERIFVVTGERYVPLVREQVPDLEAMNIVAEISGKNTAPAIGLGALHIAQVDPDATIAVLTADHIIPNEIAFRQALSIAAEVADQEHLVTLGITTTGPETGYGYIHRGEVVGTYQSQPVYAVQKFLEKPDLKTAQGFYDRDEYYWNSGMFIWQAKTLFRAFRHHAPQLNHHLRQLKTALFETQSAERVGQIWNQIEGNSIDYTFMEKAENVAVVPLDAGWNDVGSWSALYDQLTQKPNDNVVVNAPHLNEGSEGLLIQGNGKLIATIGLKDIVIVDTEDALLVCRREQTQGVKQIVTQLKNRKQDEYL